MKGKLKYTIVGGVGVLLGLGGIVSSQPSAEEICRQNISRLEVEAKGVWASWEPKIEFYQNNSYTPTIVGLWSLSPVGAQWRLNEERERCDPYIVDK